MNSERAFNSSSTDGRFLRRARTGFLRTALSVSVRRSDYDNLLTSAEQAHMNMIRVWGGGIYEMEDFYDLCDEKGLLVWQDFMFACAIYPGGAEFLASVKAEAEHQVKRLANRACLALWCGNNEIEQMPAEITKTDQRKKAYDDIFYQHPARGRRPLRRRNRLLAELTAQSGGLHEGSQQREGGRQPFLGRLACATAGETL